VIDDPDLTQREYFRMLAGLNGYPKNIIFLPVGLFVPAVIAVNFAHRLLKGRQWSVAYQLRRSGRNARYVTDAARKVLGWQPRTSVHDAVVQTAIAT
jgi:nucleoside-diphosphate-sugar epimerase